ncbi:MAG: hypothetical protein AAF600_18855, partial [Bacteroidota bacterium]
MFEDYHVCPYTGLRSFTEEESIYFKGRDEHIKEATAQLERNKFLMVTGASGDGKSSLVYAGIIPNARAGFLRSKYSNWQVIDFRPERSPYKNLCKALSSGLNIPNITTIEAELSHGFSALVDLYKNSSRHYDEHSDILKKMSPEGRQVQKREGANLIILVDQFEEFFTNPENYANGVTSRESNLVINLLLETARISMEENFPIYTVFTMRSDFIGQCTAFRGLPEFIGYSQFFVPRLNRSQLSDVIEEPAILNGNSISKRLVERLIHDIVEGVDQLPILQHALNQIWVAAESGQKQMDLIHYAMVGGLSPTELEDRDRQEYEKWFEALPEYTKSTFSAPSLQNVLDAHATNLYEQAADYYLEKTSKTISKKEAKKIVQSIFKCLTKIDQSRAVRNRMTLREIHEIMENHSIAFETLKAIINIFREPGNTLIRPFINEGEASGTLNENDVLDITHESLIRNWELLKIWAKEEYDHFMTYLDFYQQVERWEQNNRSRGFLLPIGPLTYFEKWYETLNPGAHWVKRYLKQSDKETDTKATEIIANCEDFLDQSASKHRIARAVIKIGGRKIAAVLSILVLLALSSFVFVETYNKRNDVILGKLQNEIQPVLTNPSVSLDPKSLYLVCAERNRAGSMVGTLEAINNLPDQILLASTVGIIVVGNDIHNKIYLADTAANYAIEKALKVDIQTQDKKALLTGMVQLSDMLDYHQHYYPSKTLEKDIENVHGVMAKLIIEILKDDSR